MSTTYVDLLKDPRWQRMRLRILERDAWTCQSCRETKQTLHVHHRRYERGKKPWEADENDLVTLCEACHLTTTELMRDATRILGRFDVQGLRAAVWALGVLSSGCELIPSPGWLIGEARALGFDLTPTPRNTIGVTGPPGGGLPPELAARLIQTKHEVLALLRAEDESAAS